MLMSLRSIRPTLVTKLFLGALVLGSLPPIALAQPSDTKVKHKVAASQPDATGKQMVTIQLEVENGWHIYANPVDNELLVEEVTTVKVKTKSGAPRLQVIYPRPVVMKSPLGDTMKVYEGTVQIQTVVQRANLSEPLEYTVIVYACNDKKCLPRGEIKFSVK
jgi:DsbC/DsbD-like thiol-disulfide interchange protein